MIDHVSIGVRDLARSAAFYDALLLTIGHRRMITRERTVGYGKSYPELWLNARPTLVPAADSGTHVCLRARDEATVQAFYGAAVALGGRGEGAPGLRLEYHETYYAAFVRDFDENLVEVVTFINKS